MKKYLLSLAALALLSVSCIKDEEKTPDIPDIPATVAVSSITAEFGELKADSPVINSTGGTQIITLTTDGEWSLTSSESWLTCSPSSGGAGTSEISITTQQNTAKASRTAYIRIKESPETQFCVTQLPNIYSKKKVASGTVNNSLKVSYTSANWNRIYAILPVPVTNNYQEISSFEAGSANVQECSNNVNRYAAIDIRSDFPASGGKVISESFHADAYEVTADVSLIKEIPEYDKDSDPCKYYLGTEKDDLVNPTHTKIASTAAQLWSDTEGNLIDYARKCYEWTATNMNYGNMNTGLHTIEDLMNSMTGDCGNFASVFISLLRAKGIPARHIVMISPTEAGYHVRAEFYIPGYGWIPADPTFKNSDPNGDYFGRFNGKYVVMSFGVNSYCTGPDGNAFRASLLQTFFYWYWYNSGNNISFTHSFSNFQ